MIRSLLRWSLSPALGLCLLFARTPAEAQVRINYQDAELATVVASLAEIAGLNVVFIGGDPGARVTVKMGRPIPPEDVPGLLRTILESAGFTTLDRGGLLQVIPSAQAPALGEMQVFVHPLSHASATEMALTLAATYGSTNAAQAAVGEMHPRQSLSQQLRGQSDGAYVPAFVDPGAAGERRRPEQERKLPGTVGAITVGEAVVVPYTATNSLIIRATPRTYELLRGTIEQLDTRPQQVLIEVFVAEVALDDQTQFGLDWSGALNPSDPRVIRGVDRIGSIPDETPGSVQLRLRFLAEGFDVRATLRALSATSRVNVLATPSVLARNNEQARILVGSQVPFNQSVRSGLSGEVVDRIVQFRDVGTELSIVPTINEDGYVTLEVLQQVSSLTNQTLFDAPIITVREAQTSAVVRDRQTIVIGGLIGVEREEVRRGIPLLKDIPLLGALFRDTAVRGRKTELVIFLTPYVVGSDLEVDQLRERSIGRTRESGRIERQLDRLRLDGPAAPPSAVPPSEEVPSDTLHPEGR